MASRISVTNSSLERSRSVSSMRSMKAPWKCRAMSQLNRAVCDPPRCREPVGLGEKRVRTSDIFTTFAKYSCLSYHYPQGQGFPPGKRQPSRPSRHLPARRLDCPRRQKLLEMGAILNLFSIRGIGCLTPRLPKSARGTTGPASSCNTPPARSSPPTPRAASPNSIRPRKSSPATTGLRPSTNRA